MSVSGVSIIAGKGVVGTDDTMRAVNPTTNEAFGPDFTLLSPDQISQAVATAAEAFDSYRNTEPTTRAKFLDAVADNISAVRDEIVTIAVAETGISENIIDSEINRTIDQLRLFAQKIRQGDFHGVRIDPALPDRMPTPRVDIRQCKVPLGPVVVFGASNFPLAFSVAGGDTVSALAAGCPVIVKAHNAHPGTSEIVGFALAKAVQNQGLHPGVFSLVYGAGIKVGQQLVSDERIAAVAFTGSRAGGLAIAKTVANRPIPIPVYAEMSATNPVFVLPGAIKGDSSELAKGFVSSVTNRSGQLCTSPGQIFVPTGADGDAFLETVKQEFRAVTGKTMLTSDIADAWIHGVESIRSRQHVNDLVIGHQGFTANAPAPTLVSTTLEAFNSDDAMSVEVFGAFSLIVRYNDASELPGTVARMEGQLTGTIQAENEDEQAARALIRALELKVGRILVGGWPTGVEVGPAMVHGGPFPATTDSRTTSVGTLAIERFLRPVAYQTVPDKLLPPQLQDGNPWHLIRSVNGQLPQPDQ